MSDPNLPESEPTRAMELPVGPPTEPPAVPVIRGRRRAVVAAVAVVLVAILGGGAWAVWNLISGGGPQPDSALPSSTIAEISIDLDPSAGQKIEAIKAIRKFPSLKNSLGLNTSSDLRKFLFDKITADRCPGFTFAKDVEPWIGKRAAFAAVDLGDKDPVPALAIAVTDRTLADKQFGKLIACTKTTDMGYAIGADFLIASDTKAHAQAIVKAAKAHSLADDAAYQKWTDSVGDRGVVNFYVAKKAVNLILDQLKTLSTKFGGSASSSLSSVGPGASAPVVGGPAAQSCSADPFASLKAQLQHFSGLAGTIRFADSGLELETSSSSLRGDTSSVGPQVESLPATSALVLGVATPKDFAKQLVANSKAACGSRDFVSGIRNATGLALPEDLQTLLGSALTLSIDGNLPADLGKVQSAAELPIGLVIHGDGPKIEGLIARIQQQLGRTLADLQIGVKSSAGKVVITPSESYADRLLAQGKLGQTADFKDAVPQADKAYSIFYLSFDSGLRTSLLNFAKDVGVSASNLRSATNNTLPLKSFGMSAWRTSGGDHFLLKLVIR